MGSFGLLGRQTTFRALGGHRESRAAGASGEPEAGLSPCAAPGAPVSGLLLASVEARQLGKPLFARNLDISAGVGRPGGRGLPRRAGGAAWRDRGFRDRLVGGPPRTRTASARGRQGEDEQSKTERAATNTPRRDHKASPQRTDVEEDVPEGPRVTGTPVKR
jgi:hypothetical protein